MTETLNIQLREETGKGVARTLRRDGRIPAIIYGGDKPEVKISLDQKDISLEYKKGGLKSKIVELNDGKNKYKVLPRDIQLHPVTDVPLHADFQRIDKDSRVNVMIKVDFQNAENSPGLKRGGILNVVRHRVELICPAEGIPSSIVVNLDGLVIGESVHISSVKLPKGVSPAIKDRNFTIATVAGRVAKDEAAEIEEETEEVTEEE